MGDLWRVALEKAEALDEASKDRIARSILQEVELIQTRRSTSRREQLERLLRDSPLHGRSAEFLETARELREGLEFRHDAPQDES